MNIKLYVPILLLLMSTSALAQNYKTSIIKHREAYKADFLKDTNSPLKEADLKHLHFFEPDSAFQVNAKVKLLKKQKIFNMPTYDGTSKEFIRYAQVNFTLHGQELQMVLYKNIALAMNPAYKDLLFLPFTDQTNGKTSYGGGRYIDLKISEIKKKSLIIDFNKAYNPYCAYSDGYRCPVPPEENDLAIQIRAGEKAYTGEKKHK